MAICLPLMLAASPARAVADCGIAAFRGDVALLAQQVGSDFGDPVECEHPSVTGSGTELLTTTGLAYTDPASGETGFTNGFERWLLASDGLWYFATPDALPEPVQSVAGSHEPLLPLTRSLVCPVLYTHEVASQADFSRLLGGLLAAGYHPTSLASVDLAMEGQIDRPRGCLVLTFDDGLYSQYTNALPVLARYRVPAVFFVMPSFTDGVHRYMRPAELRALRDAGHEVEAHTCNHANLVRLAARGEAALMAELLDCKRRIEAITGTPILYFAYPDGATSPPVLNAVSRAGYRAAFTTRPSAVLSAVSPLLWPRIRYDPREAPATVLQRIRAAAG